MLNLESVNGEYVARPSSVSLFEAMAAQELGQTSEYIRSMRSPTQDKYYSEYIEVLYRTWKLAWQARGEYEAGEWDNRKAPEVK